MPCICFAFIYWIGVKKPEKLLNVKPIQNSSTNKTQPIPKTSQRSDNSKSSSQTNTD